MSGTLRWSDALWLARHRTPNDRLRFWGSAVSSGVAAAVVCSALGLIALGGGIVNSELGVVAEPGTRVGVVIAVFLVALPAVHLTGQTWKLGSVERRQRLVQLRDAGAGPDELRRVVMADTVVPVGVGASLGVVLLGAVIALLNLRGASIPGYRESADGSLVLAEDSAFMPGLDVVPNVSIVSWWPPLLAIGLVSASAALAAARSVRRMDRPVLKAHSLIGFTASLLARGVGRPALLLALRRIAQDPRATTRPALLLGLAAVVAAVSSWLSLQFRLSMGEQWTQEPFYAQSFTLVGLATWVGVGLCALALLVVLADAAIRRRQADAAAVASGLPLSVLRRALVWQALLPAVPTVLLGLLIGGAASVALTGTRVIPNTTDGTVGGEITIPVPWLGWAAWGIALLVVAAVAALIASTALRRTTRVDQLRVPA